VTMIRTATMVSMEMSRGRETAVVVDVPWEIEESVDVERECRAECSWAE
jgi:hypothetical protein